MFFDKLELKHKQKNNTKKIYQVEPTLANSPEQNLPSSLEIEQGSEVAEQEVNAPMAASKGEDINSQIIENLKEQRDQLRGTSIKEAGIKHKHSKIKIVTILLISLGSLSALYILLIKPKLDSKQSTLTNQATQKSFQVPSDLNSKTSDEKNALNIISLARKNDSEPIINSYLNKAKLGQSETDFKALIASYASSADGESIELIEKKVGKVDFASTGESSAIAEVTSEFEAASLIYKSKYFAHTNNIYLKINLYKPDPTQDVWKIYIFEYKAGEGESPLRATIEVPV